MALAKRTTSNEKGHNAIVIVKKSRSHANDPYVLEKVEQAKAFIRKAGLPDLKK